MTVQSGEVPPPRLLDNDSLRALLGPRGQWACEAGRAVKSRRDDLHWSITTLAGLAGTNKQTIAQIEAGAIVPREYLKVAIANALSREVCEIWRPIKRSDLTDLGAA